MTHNCDVPSPDVGESVADVLAASEQTEDGWVHSCGATLRGQNVVHSVHEMPHALAGSGQVKTQTVPYCPTCHEPPSRYGAPITPATTEWPRVTIRRKPRSGRGGPE